MAESVTFVKPAALRQTLRAMAAVAVVRKPRFPDHFFHLDPATGSAVAAWNDFAGNRCHFRFHPAGAMILGFDHESPMSPHAREGPEFAPWSGVYDSLAVDLMAVVPHNPLDPEYDYREVTFCLWNMGDTDVWEKGTIDYPERGYGDPDGQRYILGSVRNYQDDFVSTFADKYGWELDPVAVAELRAGDVVTRTGLEQLNQDKTADVDASVPELQAMGFLVV
jgi:hypothetical protein